MIQGGAAPDAGATHTHTASHLYLTYIRTGQHSLQFI